MTRKLVIYALMPAIAAAFVPSPLPSSRMVSDRSQSQVGFVLQMADGHVVKMRFYSLPHVQVLLHEFVYLFCCVWFQAASLTTLEATRRLGIIGGGTVGGGIVDILQKKKAYIKEMTGSDIEIAALCVRDLSKKRDFGIPEGCVVTDKYSVSTIQSFGTEKTICVLDATFRSH